MLIAQMTDFHVTAPGTLAYGRVDTAEHLRTAVAHLVAQPHRPDAVLATGDLVERGTDEEYAHLRALLAPIEAPLYVIPGNHDDRPALARAFADQAYLPRDGAFVQYVIEDHPVRLVALDTLVPGKTEGALCDARLAWLDARLSEQPLRPTIVVMHHPPFETGIAAMDRASLKEPAVLEAIIRRHPQVVRILAGHLHRTIVARWAGTLASTAPSTAHQIVLDLAPGAPMRFAMEPPGYQLHLASPGGAIVTHTVAVGAFDGPYPFRGETMAR